MSSHSASAALEKLKLNLMQIQSHNDKTSPANQSVLITENGKSQLTVPTKIMFSSGEQVLRAEILQVLQAFNSNYSFASSENDNERFQIMFPDSKIAQSYRQGKTKVRYNI